MPTDSFFPCGEFPSGHGSWKGLGSILAVAVARRSLTTPYDRISAVRSARFLDRPGLCADGSPFSSVNLMCEKWDVEHRADATAGVSRQGQRHAARLRRTNRSEEHTSELQSLRHLVCRLLLEKKK